MGVFHFYLRVGGPQRHTGQEREADRQSRAEPKEPKEALTQWGGGIIDYAPFCEQEAGTRCPAPGKDVNYGSLCSNWNGW